MITNLINETTSEVVNPNIVSDNIPANAITSAKILDGAVISTKLGEGSVGSTALASGAVQSTHIASGAVTASKLENGAVQNSAISVGAVTEDKIDAGAVTNSKLAIGAVHANKINSQEDYDLAHSIGSSDLQGLISFFLAVLTDWRILKIWGVDDYGNYAGVRVLEVNSSRVSVEIEGDGVSTISSDTDASNFITDYGEYIRISKIV